MNPDDLILNELEGHLVLANGSQIPLDSLLNILPNEDTWTAPTANTAVFSGAPASYSSINNVSSIEERLSKVENLLEQFIRIRNIKVEF